MWLAWLVVVVIVVAAFTSKNWWKKHLILEEKDCNIPAACGDCNRGDCRGCLLENLTKAQANEIMSAITQQAIADGTIINDRRYEGR